MSRHHSTQDLLTQYAAFHRDRRNILTHFVGVPMIVFGIGVMLARIRLPASGFQFTAAWIVFCAAAAWYLSRRGPISLGFAVTAITGVLIGLAHGFAQGSLASWLFWGVGVFAIGWIIQFVGHYYEGRKPAFLDDLAGLLVGPMFMTAEAMFSFGWNKPLHAEIERRVGPTHLRDLAQPA